MSPPTTYTRILARRCCFCRMFLSGNVAVSEEHISDGMCDGCAVTAEADMLASLDATGALVTSPTLETPPNTSGVPSVALASSTRGGDA